MRNRRIVTWLAVWLVAAAATAYAQFGIPSVVFDPTQSVHAIEEIAQGVETVAQLLQTYRTIVSTYNTIFAMSQMLRGKNAWLYAIAPYSYPGAANVSGVTGGWMGTLNSGVAALDAWDLATLRAASPLGIKNLLSAQGQNNFAAQYGTIELREGIAQNAMTVTGSVRGNAVAQQAALAQLEGESLSDDDGENTEVGVLNKINAATMIHAKSVQDTNQYLGAIADLQTIRLKQEHDVEVDEMNSALAIQGSTDATNTSLWDGDVAAHAVRIP